MTRRSKLLIFDDVPEFHQEMRAMLSPEFQIISALSPLAALKEAKSARRAPFLNRLKMMLKSKSILLTLVILFSIFFSGCGISPHSNNMELPKNWHGLPEQRELWGLKEISFDLYQKTKIGDLATTIDIDAPQKGVLCFIFWINQDAYQACFKINKGTIADKSIRKARLVY